MFVEGSKIAATTQKGCSPFSLTGSNLDLAALNSVARQFQPVALSAGAWRAVDRSWERLNRLVSSGTRIYGVSIGLGELDDSFVETGRRDDFQRNILMSHAAGAGELMRADQVRAMMLCRLNTLSKGMSGASRPVVETLLKMLNENVLAPVPALGSVGASDLVPLAHMALPMLGEGNACHGGQKLPASAAMKNAGIELPELTGRDGLALINGLSQTKAVGALALYDALRICNQAVWTYALTAALLAPESYKTALEAARLKGHDTATDITGEFSQMLATSANEGAEKRSPLSVRYAPQVLATAMDALKETRKVLAAELKAVDDNPIIAKKSWHTNNAANTSGHRLAFAFDQAVTAMVSLSVASERRIAQMLRKRPPRKLRPYLIHPDASPGQNHGLMISQYTAASLLGEMRARSMARSIQSIPTGGTFEDLVPFSAQSALNFDWMVRAAEQIFAIELLAAMQGFDCMRSAPSGRLAGLYEKVRQIVPPMVSDRVISEDIAALVATLREGRLDLPDFDEGWLEPGAN